MLDEHINEVFNELAQSYIPVLGTSFSCQGQQTVFSKGTKHAPVYNAVRPKIKEEMLIVA